MNANDLNECMAGLEQVSGTCYFNTVVNAFLISRNIKAITRVKLDEFMETIEEQVPKNLLTNWYDNVGYCLTEGLIQQLEQELSYRFERQTLRYIYARLSLFGVIRANLLKKPQNMEIDEPALLATQTVDVNKPKAKTFEETQRGVSWEPLTAFLHLLYMDAFHEKVYITNYRNPALPDLSQYDFIVFNNISWVSFRYIHFYKLRFIYSLVAFIEDESVEEIFMKKNLYWEDVEMYLNRKITKAGLVFVIDNFIELLTDKYDDAFYREVLKNTYNDVFVKELLTHKYDDAFFTRLRDYIIVLERSIGVMTYARMHFLISRKFFKEIYQNKDLMSYQPFLSYTKPLDEMVKRYKREDSILPKNMNQINALMYPYKDHSIDHCSIGMEAAKGHNRLGIQCDNQYILVDGNYPEEYQIQSKEKNWSNGYLLDVHFFHFGRCGVKPVKCSYDYVCYVRRAAPGQ